METQLLRDRDIFPSKEVLENAIGDSYPVFEELMETIEGAGFGLAPEWNYYKDGKAWLCKVLYKKKTIFWLSVWDKFFKTSFFFTEKTRSGVVELDIEESIKEGFSHSKPIGKLIPLVISIDRKEQLKDLLRVIEYKKSLK
jgi:hypothetical protein